jgi:2-oxoisovalerate dehydrogenase E2 component (dihydrolipoyl transacylase)
MSRKSTLPRLEALRAQLNARYGEERGKLTLLPLLMRAVVLAMRRFPEVNARFDDGRHIVTRYQPVHLGVAAQTDAGLMVPVMRNAEARDPWSSATEVARLAEAARTGKAARDELSGSTITITSLGRWAASSARRSSTIRKWRSSASTASSSGPVIRNGGMVPRKLMNLSSSFDHRVIDGMVAAEFIQAVRGYLESPAITVRGISGNTTNDDGPTARHRRRPRRLRGRDPRRPARHPDRAGRGRPARRHLPEHRLHSRPRR